MERYLTKNASSSRMGNTLSTKGNGIEQKRAHVELNMDDIIVNPGLQKSIEEFDLVIRDEAKRAFLSMGSVPTAWPFFSTKRARKPKESIYKIMVS